MCCWLRDAEAASLEDDLGAVEVVSYDEEEAAEDGVGIGLAPYESRFEVGLGSVEVGVEQDPGLGRPDRGADAFQARGPPREAVERDELLLSGLPDEAIGVISGNLDVFGAFVVCLQLQRQGGARDVAEADVADVRGRVFLRVLLYDDDDDVRGASVAVPGFRLVFEDVRRGPRLVDRRVVAAPYASQGVLCVESEATEQPAEGHVDLEAKATATSAH
mmetsp:Transcript_13234/g.43138  ORF Transcript_13234/g.43138 Transcript_13234/m.43138 type:complete len:218 (-) Transcript_13234:304-957(-)